TLFSRGALGLGTAALASLLRQGGASIAEAGEVATPSVPAQGRFGGLPDVPHFAPKAKRVIYPLPDGAPTHVDLSDDKPDMENWRGNQIPDDIQKGQRLSTMTQGQTARPVLPPITKFARHGESGATVCDFLPNIASIADECCFIKSMHTEAVNHAP